VNPELHDEFVALCALYGAGELTEEEWALLQVHLAYCESCSKTFQQYQLIADHVVPALAESAYAASDLSRASSSFSIDAAERKLMSRLDLVSAGPVRSRAKPQWQIISAGLLAACLVAMASGIGVHLHRSKSGVVTETHGPLIEKPSAPSNSASAENQTHPDLMSSNSDRGHAPERLDATMERPSGPNPLVTTLEQKLKAEQDERQAISAQRDALSQQLSTAQAEAQALRDKSSEAHTQTAQQTMALEAKLQEVNTALEDKDRMLELDKEFLAHDHEIRDLIGARNLYIADIYDVAQNGQTAKPFGRIFYTKDRSLVFYGYDLDKQSGLKQAVAFQAWGSGDHKQNVSLGLFYQDDTHKRWVLRFNDTKTLSRLNMVFVTAEPQGGSTKPTGKPLLLAYLQVQPNHP
jgi:hypothetical protein